LDSTAEQIQEFMEACATRGRRTEPLILLVEDQRFYQQVFREALGPGFTVLTADSAQAGWEIYLERAPDIAFLDVELGETSGHVLAMMLRHLDAEAFLVMVTGNNDEDTVARAIENRVRGFIAKPYNQKKLHESIALYASERTRAASLPA